MSGSFGGDILALIYFLLFQAAGLAFSFALLKGRSMAVRLLAGSVTGSVFLQWFPVIFSFALGFSFASHIIAALCAAAVAVVCLMKFRAFSDISLSGFRVTVSFAVITFTAVLFSVLVISGIRFSDGSLYSSQATYGDMSMHLGFITSIAEQGTFPPEYSILPGTKLCYPFLSDSISSSLYLLGAEIKFAYCLPMIFAGVQVFSGAYLFLKSWLRKSGKALLAFAMFFCCGGFGFAYFFEDTAESGYNFTRIFTEFYETPTNYVEENVRFSNMIVDMLFPQRATLFGYAVLFCCLLLLYQVTFGEHRDSRGGFVYLGILGGALPMIHTHSFLALAVISACFLFARLYAEIKGKCCGAVVKVLFFAELAFLTVWSYHIYRNDLREDSSNMYVLAVFLALAVFALVLLIARFIVTGGFRQLAFTWGVYLVIVLLLALPQLIIWTFSQATGDNFLRPYFNWANNGDNYLWFYIKNLGLTGIFGVLGFLSSRKKVLAAALPVPVILFIAELVCFQPNTYDNNKLLYPAYLFLCAVAAEFMFTVYEKLSDVPHISAAAGACVCVCLVSGVLTIGRELNAEYQLIGKNYMDAAEFIYEDSSPEDTVLTNNRHNNEVAMLTGRNIVCGAGTFLYYHGLDYYEQEKALSLMFENPAENYELFEEYSVDYVYVSDYETASYDVDEEAIADMFELVYENPQVRIYKTGLDGNEAG